MSPLYREVEDLGELIAHALRALRDCLPNDNELTTKNVSVGYVGRDVEFTMKDDEDVEEYLKVFFTHFDLFSRLLQKMALEEYVGSV